MAAMLSRLAGLGGQGEREHLFSSYHHVLGLSQITWLQIIIVGSIVFYFGKQFISNIISTLMLVVANLADTK